jgi:uncharacterized protein YegL
MTNTIPNTTFIQEVIAIIDRSGSMCGKEEDTIGGINSALKVLRNEKEDNTKINVSIKLFDHEEYLLIRSLNINRVRPITHSQYMPRGQTALLDALGNTLSYFMEKKLDDPTSYDMCLIYVVTDGMENCSKFYNSDQIASQIKNAEENYNIKIVYLGANQDAIMEASKYGIAPERAMNYSETSQNVDSAFRSAASITRRQRTTGETSFLQSERNASQSHPPISSPPQRVYNATVLNPTTPPFIVRKEPPNLKRQKSRQ